jgi:hypothetical protein
MSLFLPVASAAANPIEAAISWALSHNGQNFDPGYCQKFVHDAYQAAGVDINSATDVASAVDYWNAHGALQHKKTDPDGMTPPRGALVYWDATPPPPPGGKIPANKYGHVGISLGGGQVISTESWSSSVVWIFSLTARNAAGYPYLGWIWPPNVNVSDSSNLPMANYLGHIVQWNGDTKPQKTAWEVYFEDGHVRRRWIPDIKTYWCLKGQGDLGPDVLTSQQLDAMPDHTTRPSTGQPAFPGNVWASCSTPGQGRGGDGGFEFSEQAGHYGSQTFSDYHNASGAGPAIAPGQYVAVECKVLDGTVASTNPDGYWYQIDGSPWNGAYWAPANVFMNGDPWNGPYSHNTDFNVPDCGKSSGASNTAVTSILEQQGHHGSNTFTNYHNASGAGASVASGQYVGVSCKVFDSTIASVNPDGYWYRLADSPWNGNYYAPANTFMNGDPWNGPYTHNTDFNVPDCPSAQPPPPPATYAEQQGHHGVNTFTNYHNASGMGPAISPAAWVNVSCKVYDPTIASVNPDGYWYRIADSPWSNAYYAPANTFMNGDPWNGPYTHNTDFNVPTCGSSPTLYSEQQGHHGVNTFTNYHNASGMGPAISPAAWVNVSCKVYDPTIASVNPDGYWYRIADSPWSNAYYAPANTFMNGDPWTGPYAHNTDLSVPNC